MAKEIQFAAAETGTYYAHLWNATGSIYNTVGAAFEAYLTANIADYDIALAIEGTASRLYTGTFPVVAAGVYQLTVQKQSGGSPAEADEYVGAGEAEWSGTALLPRSSVIADTDNIQTRLPAALVGGRMDSSVGAMEAGVVTAAAVATNAIDADALAADAVTEIQSGLATAASLTTAQVDLDDIQTRLPAALVSGRMDSSVGAMAADVVTAASIAANAIGASELAADAVGEIADQVWDEAMSDHTAAGSFGRRLQIVRDGTAAAGAAGSITLDAGASATDDFYNDSTVFVLSGTGAGQARLVSDYVGSTKVASVVPNWVTNPDATSVFVLLPAGRVDVGQWVDVVPNALVSGRMDSDVGNMQADTVTAAAIAANAVGASELAADAVTEIQSGLATAAALVTAQADLDDIQTRLPAALVGGRMDSSVGAVAANAITAAGIADGAIDAATFAAGAIDAAAIAAGAVDADAIAADAVAEIADGVWDELKAGHTTPDSFGDYLDDEITSRATPGAEMDLVANAVDAAAVAADAVTEIQSGLATAASLTTAQADLDDIQARLPAALSGGKMDSTLSSGERESIASALLDLANGIETGYTMKQTLRLIAASVAGKVSGVQSNAPVFRSLDDSANRITATVDADGNRTVVTHGA